MRIDDISRESLKVEEDLVEDKLVEEQFFSQKNSVNEELVEEDFKEKNRYNFTDCFSCQDKALCRG